MSLQKKIGDDINDHQKNNFNLLRLVAAWLVLFSHSYAIVLKESLQPSLRIFKVHFVGSELGLCIFFTISGYLVSQSFDNSSSFLHFLWKRFLRIVPALAVVNLFCVLFGGIITTHTQMEYFSNPSTWSYFFINTSLVRNQYYLPGVFTSLKDATINASIWTIVAEVKFYILLCLAGIAGFLKNRILLLVGFLIFCILYVLFISHVLPVVKFINLTPYFGFGIYFYLGVLYYQFRNSMKYTWYIACLLFLLCLVLNKSFWWHIPQVILISYLIIWIGKSKALIKNLKNDLSYGLYLYAFPVQQFIVTITGYEIPVWQHIILSTLIASILAWLSWKFIEYPALTKKDIWLKRKV